MDRFVKRRRYKKHLTIFITIFRKVYRYVLFNVYYIFESLVYFFSSVAYSQICYVYCLDEMCNVDNGNYAYYQ